MWQNLRKNYLRKKCWFFNRLPSEGREAQLSPHPDPILLPTQGLSSYTLVKETFLHWHLPRGSALGYSPHSLPPAAHGSRLCVLVPLSSDCSVPAAPLRPSQEFSNFRSRRPHNGWFPCTKHSEVRKRKARGLAGCHSALNPVIPGSGEHNPENQSLHALLSCFSCARRFATLWTIAHQAPPSMGFSRQEYWSGLTCPPPGHLPDPGVKPNSLMSPVLAGEFFTTSAT